MRNDIDTNNTYTLTIAETARIYHIGQNTIRNYIREHPNADFVFRVGKKILIKTKEFEHMIDENNTI